MKFIIIGIDDNSEQFFSPQVLAHIQGNSVFSGGARHHDLVKNHLPDEYQWIEVIVPLKTVFEEYEQHDTIVVFASGDPLFLGIGNTIKREFPTADIEVFPYFNSLQILAHRMLLPYQDMHIVSLTGRPWDKFDEALIEGKAKVGVLTDRVKHTPQTIAARMLAYGYNNYEMIVGELLGNKESEKVTTLSLEEVIKGTFQYPNNLILLQKERRIRPFGISNSEFHLLNGRDKMITKMPIRLLSLSEMDLRDRSVLWDVGFCTGSISIESKLQFPHLKVIAFEQRTEGEELMRLNSQKFGTPGIEAHIGDFLEADLTDLPKPDAVFIGGHGGKMFEFMQRIHKVLLPNGCIVFNSVSADSQKAFFDAAKSLDMVTLEPTLITIDSYNPIMVMKAIKPI